MVCWLVCCAQQMLLDGTKSQPVLQLCFGNIKSTVHQGCLDMTRQQQKPCERPNGGR
jgi:hypothetical protein